MQRTGTEGEDALNTWMGMPEHRMTSSKITAIVIPMLGVLR